MFALLVSVGVVGGLLSPDMRCICYKVPLLLSLALLGPSYTRVTRCYAWRLVYATNVSPPRGWYVAGDIREQSLGALHSVTGLARCTYGEWFLSIGGGILVSYPLSTSVI